MTWNPVTGCSKISPGCAHCYADGMAKRLKAMGVERYSNGFEVTLHPDLVDVPKNWKSPRRIFVNSMSDLFHEQVPLEFISRVFQTMNDCPQHSFQILTKRSGRLLELAPSLKWTSNYLDGSDGGKQQLCWAHSRPQENAGSDSILVSRTFADRNSVITPRRDPLGDRRRRVRPGCERDAEGMGGGDTKAMP
jgi:Protein of unknown function (DUF5131)